VYKIYLLKAKDINIFVFPIAFIKNLRIQNKKISQLKISSAAI